MTAPTEAKLRVTYLLPGQVSSTMVTDEIDETDLTKVDLQLLAKNAPDGAFAFRLVDPNPLVREDGSKPERQPDQQLLIMKLFVIGSRVDLDCTPKNVLPKCGGGYAIVQEQLTRERLARKEREDGHPRPIWYAPGQCLAFSRFTEVIDA